MTTTITLTPDELRVILSALSVTIIEFNKDSNNSNFENIEVYKRLHKIAKKKYPNWLITNLRLAEILKGGGG